MGFFSDDKPFTAVSAAINQLLAEKSVEEFEPEIQLPGLLETIKIQGSEGATEAARAIRKKLKYGSPSVQYRALIVLELLVSNGGKPLSPLYNDSRLLERLRLMMSDDNVIPRVRKKLIAMVIGWKSEFSGDSKYAELVALNRYAKQYYKPKRNMPHRRTREVPLFMDDTAEDLPDDEISSIMDDRAPGTTTINRGNGSNRDLDRAYEIPNIDLKEAAPEINRILSDATSSATILKNELQQLDRKTGELAVDSDKCTLDFDKCRQIRRKVLRYLQLVQEGHFLGLLIHANDELVDALQKYSDYSKPLSLEEEEEAAKSAAIGGSGSRAPRSGFISDDDEESLATGADTRASHDGFSVNNYESEEDDEDNPFADRNKVVE